MTYTKDDPTELVLFGMGVHPYSARGLSQSLEPIEGSKHLERSVNGELLDMSSALMQKYRSVISGQDQRPPAVDGVWPGKILVVDCIAKISVYGGPPFQREAVDYDSVISELGFSTYRPRLTMMVMSFTMDEEEWAAGVNWSMELEEV